MLAAPMLEWAFGDADESSVLLYGTLANSQVHNSRPGQNHL